jgi:ADP-heptose:LPS heptosyltransferase
MTMPEYALRESKTAVKYSISFEQLLFMAYNGDYDSVYSHMVRFTPEDRKKYANKYIYFETLTGSIKNLSELKNYHEDLLVHKEKKFLLEILDLFISECINNSSFPRQLYQSILKVAEELTRLSDFNCAIEYLNKAIALGVNKFPELKTEVLFSLAEIYNRRGDLVYSENYLNQLLLHPYLITDRNRVAELLQNVSQLYLKQGKVDRYKNFLFLGLKYFYTNPDNRRKIFEQIRLTYRRSLKVIFNSDVNIQNRFIFLIHWYFFKLPNFSKIKLGFANKIALRVLMGTIYLINYSQKTETTKNLLPKNNENSGSLYLLKSQDYLSEKSIQSVQTKKILITRAMGGIGDLLMMTPGIHALRQKHPESEINLAIPKRYFSVFEGNDDVKLLDIEGDFFSHLTFNKWYNFTDCPAARKESISAPRVTKSRIDIFTSALNVGLLTRNTVSKKPRYFINQNELNFCNDFWRNNELNEKIVVGVQLHSDETYRDYPLMENLVKKLAEKYPVLIFDSETINGFDFENVIKIQNLSIRKAFALAHMCSAIVAPDSSFIHFAAAFDIPTIALFGPIDGKVRTKHYPNCTYLSAKDLFGCMPCWRNESIPCKLTGMRTSECMKQIPVNQILNVLEMKLNGENVNA